MKTFEEWRADTLDLASRYLADDDPEWEPPPICHALDADGRHWVVDLLYFFNGDVKRKELLATLALPGIASKTQAKFLTLTLGAWISKLTGNSIIDQMITEQIERDGVASLPPRQREETQIVFIADIAREEAWSASVERGAAGVRRATDWNGIEGHSGRFAGALSRALRLADKMPYREMMRLQRLGGLELVSPEALIQMRRQRKSHLN